MSLDSVRYIPLDNQMAELVELFDSFACKICQTDYNFKENYPNVICQNFHLACRKCWEDLRETQHLMLCPFCRILTEDQPIKFRQLFVIKEYTKKAISSEKRKSLQKTRKCKSFGKDSKPNNKSQEGKCQMLNVSSDPRMIHALIENEQLKKQLKNQKNKNQKLSKFLDELHEEQKKRSEEFYTLQNQFKNKQESMIQEKNKLLIQISEHKKVIDVKNLLIRQLREKGAQQLKKMSYERKHQIRDVESNFQDNRYGPLIEEDSKQLIVNASSGMRKINFKIRKPSYQQRHVDQALQKMIQESKIKHSLESKRDAILKKN